MESDFEGVGRQEAVETVRELYGILRELTDAGIVSLDGDDGLANDIRNDVYHALTRGADVLAAVYGPGAVK